MFPLDKKNDGMSSFEFSERDGAYFQRNVKLLREQVK